MSAAFRWPHQLVTSDAQREDELRAEIDTAGPMKLQDMVTDGLYSFSCTPGDTVGPRRLGVLLVALREADARAALPREVALAFDLLLATVIDNTLEHRSRYQPPRGQ